MSTSISIIYISTAIILMLCLVFVLIEIKEDIEAEYRVWAKIGFVIIALALTAIYVAISFNIIHAVVLNDLTLLDM